MTPAPGSTINWSSPVQFSITVDYYFEGVDANIFGGWVDTNDEIAVVGPNGNGDYLDTLLTGSNSGSFTYTWTETVDPHTTDPLIRNNPYQFNVGIITASVSFLDPNPPPPDLRVGYDELIVYFY
ncbi:MAG: hypothetical protein JSV00_01720 [bacterium]|nr:MAG: hypothetical protein JSV00_01720 [bacterium]